MCGRYVITKPISKTHKIVKTSIKVENIDNYNAHPTQKLPIIKSYSNGRAIENYEWGLVPNWSKKLDKFTPLINARKETLGEKVTFKSLIQSSRCLVIADGYYEWKRGENIKIPFYFFRKDKRTMYFAAIYQNYQFCIITREASQIVSEVHTREPLILEEKHIADYLNTNINANSFLDSIPGPNLEFFEVSKEVNKPINNDPSLINQI